MGNAPIQNNEIIGIETASFLRYNENKNNNVLLIGEIHSDEEQENNYYDKLDIEFMSNFDTILTESNIPSNLNGDLKGLFNEVCYDDSMSEQVHEFYNKLAINKKCGTVCLRNCDSFRRTLGMMLSSFITDIDNIKYLNFNVNHVFFLSVLYYVLPNTDIKRKFYGFISSNLPEGPVQYIKWVNDEEVKGSTFYESYSGDGSFFMHIPLLIYELVTTDGIDFTKDISTNVYNNDKVQNLSKYMSDYYLFAYAMKFTSQMTEQDIQSSIRTIILEVSQLNAKWAKIKNVFNIRPYDMPINTITKFLNTTMQTFIKLLSYYRSDINILDKKAENFIDDAYKKDLQFISMLHKLYAYYRSEYDIYEKRIPASVFFISMFKYMALRKNDQYIDITIFTQLKRGDDLANRDYILLMKGVLNVLYDFAPANYENITTDSIAKLDLKYVLKGKNIHENGFFAYLGYMIGSAMMDINILHGVYTAPESNILILCGNAHASNLLYAMSGPLLSDSQIINTSGNKVFMSIDTIHAVEKVSTERKKKRDFAYRKGGSLYAR